MDWVSLISLTGTGSTRYATCAHSRGRVDLAVDPKEPNIIRFEVVTFADIEAATRRLALYAGAPTTMQITPVEPRPQPKPKKRGQAEGARLNLRTNMQANPSLEARGQIKRGPGRHRKLPTPDTSVSISEMDGTIEALQRVPEAHQQAIAKAHLATMNPRTDLTLAVRHYYAALVEMLDWKRGVIDHPHSWIAKKLGINPRTSQRYRKELVRKGLLIVRDREEAGSCNIIFEVTFPVLAKTEAGSSTAAKSMESTTLLERATTAESTRMWERAV